MRISDWSSDVCSSDLSILSTLASLDKQDYPAPLEVLVINDGSTDATGALLAGVNYPWLRVIDLAQNGGKAHALNEGPKLASPPLTITLDRDSSHYRDSLKHLVGLLLSARPNTAPVAGRDQISRP